MQPQTIGDQILEQRTQKGWTQEQLADRCELDIRTIQRIEKGEVKPYFSTLNILARVLETDFLTLSNSKPWQFSDQELTRYREIFKRRRMIRLVIFFLMLSLLLAVAATFPHFRLFGMAKMTWAPFFYLLMFGLLAAIGITWRCPACRAPLGNPFHTRYCSRCGIHFNE